MNPLALIERYGADATRYGLMKMASSQDVPSRRVRSRRGGSSLRSSGAWRG